jgi:hypothetical protein
VLLELMNSFATATSPGNNTWLPHMCRFVAEQQTSHEAECKSSGGKWPASTSLQRKTLISFGFAETSGAPPDAPHSLLGFAGE